MVEVPLGRTLNSTLLICTPRLILHTWTLDCNTSDKSQYTKNIFSANTALYNKNRFFVMTVVCLHYSEVTVTLLAS